MSALLIEQFVATPQTVTRGESGKIRFSAIVSQADYVNANRRLYPFEVLWPAFEKVNAEIDRHPGAVDHPDFFTGGGGISDIGIRWIRFWAEGKLILGEGEIIPTAKGRDLAALIEAQLPVGFSTRGYGMGEEEMRDGEMIDIIKSYELETVDAVVTPSVSGARLMSYQKEEKERMDKLQEATQRAESAEASLTEAQSQLTEAQTQLEAANSRIAELEEAKTTNEAALTEARTEAETLRGRVTELESVATEVELEKKLLDLTREHRFGEAIRTEARELGVTLENVDRVVTRLAGLVEQAALADAVTNPPEPRGEPLDETEEDGEKGDGLNLTEDQIADLRAAGLWND